MVRSPDSYEVASGYSLFREDLEHIDREAAALWEGLTGASLFITGGTGFFGMWLLEGLLWANAARDLKLHVTVLSRDPNAFFNGRGCHFRNNPALTVVRGNVATFTAEGRRFTHIIHAASESKASDAVFWSASHINASLAGTRRVIELAAQHGTQAVLLTSSGAVYRHLDPPADLYSVEGPAERDDYVGIRPTYAESKRMMELMLAAGGEQHGFRTAIARCFAFAGAYMPLNGGLALGDFIRDAIEDRAITVHGDGTAVRSYLYAADLTVWLLMILMRGADCHPYNVGGTEAVSIAELARDVNKAVGRPESSIVGPMAASSGCADVYLPSLCRSIEELGVRQAIDLQDSIRRTLTWFGRFKTERGIDFGH